MRREGTQIPGNVVTKNNTKMTGGRKRKESATNENEPKKRVTKEVLVLNSQIEKLEKKEEETRKLYEEKEKEARNRLEEKEKEYRKLYEENWKDTRTHYEEREKELHKYYGDKEKELRKYYDDKEKETRKEHLEEIKRLKQKIRDLKNKKD